LSPLRGGSGRLVASGLSAAGECSLREAIRAVLSLVKLRDAEYVLSQIAGGLEEYYTSGLEAPGVWAGRWSEQLGLSGLVEADHLRALVKGVDPITRTALLQEAARKVNAFDATFSAPKSASLLWALGGPDVESAVSIAHVEAVSTTLSFLEDHAAVARQQIGGVWTRVPTEGLAVATFVHRTSRAGDPQLHTHCVISNLVRRHGADRLNNNTTATAMEVSPDGLEIRTDDGRATVLDPEFVAGIRPDGRPNLSHAWACTVEGAQVGTWEQVHLLGNAALDRQSGYVGQSRGRRPTHTWNARREHEADHGGHRSRPCRPLTRCGWLWNATSPRSSPPPRIPTSSTGYCRPNVQSMRRCWLVSLRRSITSWAGLGSKRSRRQTAIVGPWPI
jgi:TrwC relaxase